MKQCEKCSYVNEDNTSQCINCGAILSGPSPIIVNNNNYLTPVKTNGLAVASMVLGILGLLFDCFRGLGVILSILAIIFGGVAINSIGKSNGQQGGKGMAITGLVLGIISVAFVVICIIFAASLITSLGMKNLSTY